MKKSLLNIVTLALVIVNLVLSVVIIFSILPTSLKTDKMITQICSALSLDLENNKSASDEQYKIEQLETFDIKDKLTIPLKKGEDGKEHFAVVSVSIVVDNKNKDYKKYKDSITEKESLIKDAINSEIGGFTIEELEANSNEVQNAVLLRLQKLFDSDFIVKVAFRDILFK